MSGTRVPLPDGTFAYFPEGTPDAEMAAAMDKLLPAQPPPGVIIHDVNRSYVTGPPGSPSVDTTGMAAGTGMGAEPGTNPALPDRNTAAAALAMRRDNPVLNTLAGSAPLVQGATFGFGDEALSAAAAAGGAMLRDKPFDQTYALAQEAQRQALAQARAEHPYASGVLQAGGALTTLPLLAAAGLPVAAAGGGALGARMLAGTGIGALYGGAEGFGSGSGLSDRLKQGLHGAEAGAVIGGLVPPVAQGVGSLVTRGLDWFNVTPYLQQLGVGRSAANAVNRALEHDDAFTGVGLDNITRAGPEGMLADAGASTQGLLDRVIQGGGGGSRAAREAIDQRGTAANQTLTDALDRALGPPQGVGTMVANINQAGRAGRRSAYDAAYSTPIDYSAPQSQALRDLLDRVPGDVIGTANRLMQLGGHQSQQIQATIGQDGNVVFTRLPDVRQIDYITRAMRQLAESQATTGALGRATPLSAAYSNLAGDIRGTTRNLVPEYGAALDTAADDIGRVQATRLGNDILSPGMTRDDVAQALNNHTNSAAEMAAVRSGVRANIDDVMARVRAIATDPNQDAREAAAALGNLNSRATQDKLGLILDPLQQQQLATQIEQASRAIQLRANMTTNSKTFGRLVQQQAAQAQNSGGMIDAATAGEPLNILKRAIQTVTGNTPARALTREDAMNQQIAELLTTARGQAAQDRLGLLRQAYAAAPQNAAIGQQAGGLTGLLAAIPGYAAARNLMPGLLGQ